jgi:hypothetical protein
MATFNLLERQVAKRIWQHRANAPTLSSVLWRWQSLPGLLVVGIACTGTLLYLTRLPNSALPHYMPIASAAFFLGGMFRDFGAARNAARIWPAQVRFVDWKMIEEAATDQPTNVH